MWSYMTDFTDVNKIVIPEGEIHEILNGDELLFIRDNTFVNRVPYSIDSNGHRYCDCGYYDGHRLNVDGTVSVQEGSTVTGFIRARVGDVIEFSGVKWMYDEVDRKWDDTRHCYVTVYDNNFQLIESTQNNYQKVVDESTFWFVGEVTKNLLTGVKQITLSGFSNIAYVRISAFGEGKNMVVSIRENILINPSYTNKVPTSIDTDGTIYNGHGYMDGKRLSSSGALKDEIKSTTTGFIPVKGGDIIRIGGVEWMYKDVSTNYLAAYDSSFNFIGAVYSMYGTYGTSMWDWIAGTPNHGAAIKLKNLNNIAYIRCNAIGKSQGHQRGINAIVTVNEKIIPPTQKRTNCTNLVPTSIDTDGSIYQGTGYLQNYRVNSSYILTAFKNLVTTGYIPYKQGDIIRMCDVSWIPEDFGETDNTDLYCYIAFYDKDFNGLGSVNATVNGGASFGICGALESAHHVTTDNFGVTTFNMYFTDESQIAYFRISAYGYGGDMIVTTNEEIVEGLIP